MKASEAKRSTSVVDVSKRATTHPHASERANACAAFESAAIHIMSRTASARRWCLFTSEERILPRVRQFYLEAIRLKMGTAWGKITWVLSGFDPEGETPVRTRTGSI